MAIVKHPAGSLGAMQEGEVRLVKYLEVNLPDCHYLVPNLSLTMTSKNGQVQVLEYDLLVVSPHAIYNVENKDWGGRLEGDDRYWYINGKERKCPLLTTSWKTGVLASKLRKQNRNWGKAWIQTTVTLSHPHQTKQGLWGDCLKATFLLDMDFIDYIDDSDSVNKDHDEIEDIQKAIVEFLVGAHAGVKKEDRKRIFEFDILEILDQSDNYAEYLGKPADIASSVRCRIREYALGLINLPLDKREQQRRIIKNQYFALKKIKGNPFILNVDFRIDDESHAFYEISEYLDENSLRAELQRRTFTFDEKLNIIENVVSALEAAHAADIYHRDINPENIFLTNGFATLGNFGKSYFIDHHQQGFTVMPTLTESTIGSYHAMELLSGDASRTSDIYSLGILIYELFVDQLPVKDPIELNSLGGQLPPNRLPTAVNNSLPEWLDELCAHTILNDPEARWDNLGELKDFLQRNARKAVTQPAISESGERDIYNLDNLKPGARIGVYTLYEPLGKGGFSRVFKVRHTIQSQDYAMKIFNESVDATAVQKEYEALKDLNHPNIVRFIWNDLLPNGQFYTLMEYIDGHHLKDYTHGQLRLPLTKVYDLADSVLSALVYMQNRRQPLFHRDIKPNNILWDKAEHFVLIDFNVAAIAEADYNFVGTNPYIAPDLAVSAMEVNWDTSADPFALGITLYELVCKQYPYAQKAMAPVEAEPRDPRSFNGGVSDAFAEFLMQAVRPKKSARFADANAMQAALQQIGRDGVIREKSVELSPVSPQEGQDWQEAPLFVDYLNSLFSQSRHGNAGTRARQQANPYDNATYTETFLDRKLIPAVKDGNFKLVIITGNAGDGKTAFIHKIEKEADNYRPLSHGNGGEFYFQGVRFLSNYDGSQDQQDRANNDVLAEFFQPFSELTEFYRAEEGRIIAINEGRLVEFLETASKKDRFKGLYQIISDYFTNQGEQALPNGLSIINLNLRSVTAGENSILRRQVRRLTDKALWTNCEGCAVKNRCFIKYNADSFNDPATGDELISRLEWMVETARLRREFHITIRDLRSFLAFMLTKDYRCSDVEQLHQDSQHKVDQYLRHYYFNIGDYYADDHGNNDRLVRLIRDIDVAQTPLPQRDRDLYFEQHNAADFIDFQEREFDLLEVFNAQKQLLPAHQQDNDHVIRTRIFHNLFARHQYFEGKIDYKNRLPYHSAFDFRELLQHPDDAKRRANTLRSVAEAIALNEGCEHPAFYSQNVVLSSSHVKDPYSFSFRLFSLEDFELKVNDARALATYLEYEPDSLLLYHKRAEHIKLNISLDLFEMLHFIQKGFTPSLNDLKGRFIELEIFKNLLENMDYNQVIVTRDNVDFFKIQMTPDRKLVLEKMKV